MFDLKNIKIEHVLIIGVVIWYLCSKRNQENMSNSSIGIRVPVKCKGRYCTDQAWGNVFDFDDIAKLRSIEQHEGILKKFPKGLNHKQATEMLIKVAKEYGITGTRVRGGYQNYYKGSPGTEPGPNQDSGLIGLYKPN